MDLTSSKPAIINACTPTGWYPAGSKRLERSLNHVGWAGETVIWTDWPDSVFDRSCPYTIKAEALRKASFMGFTHVLWADSSAWAIQDPMPIFDYINEHGYFLWKSGYNCAQTCNDQSLDYFGVNRDQAEQMPDCGSSIFGMHLQNPIGNEIRKRFLDAAEDGVFHGSRFHDGQSNDPRFLFHRQDQSALSLIAGTMGLEMTNPGEFCSFWAKDVPESVVFTLRGI